MKLVAVFSVLIFLISGITGLDGDTDNDKNGAALSDTASAKDLKSNNPSQPGTPVSGETESKNGEKGESEGKIKNKKTKGHEDAKTDSGEVESEKPEENEEEKPKRPQPSHSKSRSERAKPKKHRKRPHDDDTTDSRETGTENEGESEEKVKKPKKHRKQHKHHHDDDSGENEAEEESENKKPKRRPRFKLPALRPEDDFSTTYQNSYDKGAEKFTMNKKGHRRNRKDDD